MIWICSLKLHVVFVKMKLLLISLKFIWFNSSKITKFDRVGSRDSMVQSFCWSRKPRCFKIHEKCMSCRNARDFHKETWFTPKPFIYFHKYFQYIFRNTLHCCGSRLYLCKGKPNQSADMWESYCIHSPVLLNKTRLWDCENSMAGEFLTKTAGFC